MEKLLYEASKFRTATFIWGVTWLSERSERNNKELLHEKTCSAFSYITE